MHPEIACDLLVIGSGAGGLSAAVTAAPRRRPSKGAAQIERPPKDASGVLPWKSGMPLPSTNCRAVWRRKNSTIFGPACKKARARASSNCAPNSWRR